MGECVDSVRELTDDIVVVDAESRDRTREICRAKGARVLTRPWPGFSEQKNFGNAQARHDWILSLDADERVTPELAQAIRREFGHGGPGRAAYAIRFNNYFGQRRVRFGAWNPEWHVRLFDRRRCAWNTDEVHEGLQGLVAGECGRLPGCIRHLTVASRAELAAKTRRYSELFARKLRRCGRVPGWAKVWLNPAWRFGRDFFLRLGLLDGAAGWAIAYEAARYTHLKYARATPARLPGRPVEWLAPLAASALGAALTAAVLFALPTRAHRAGSNGAESRLVSAPPLAESSQTSAAITLDDADEDDRLHILPDDDDDVLT